jgi:hypothetical protein
MTAPPETVIPTVCKPWLNAASALLACQLKLIEAQYEAGLKLVEVALGGAAATGARPAADDLEKLERLAAERIGRGLAPPREIYQLPYRTRIDWTRFPEWARPSDPEMFEGSGHEG